MTEILSIETTTHGRVLTTLEARPTRLLVGFHGYGQSAEIMLADLERLAAGRSWSLAAVQALHRFYTRDNERVIANWMTRQNRDEAIADNVVYVDRALDAIVKTQAALAGPRPDQAAPPIVLVGFSQGVAMAYRAAVLGRHVIDAIVALGGDIPPELKDASTTSRTWPRLLVGAGDRETWYTPAKLDADIAFLSEKGVPHYVVRFAGGHEWTDEFRSAAAAWVEAGGRRGR